MTILRDMPAPEYHSLDAVGGTALKDILPPHTPLHFWARHVDSARVVKTTPAMRLGTLVHLAVLEPERYAREVVVAPSGIDRRTKAGKEAWETFAAECGGKEIVSAEDADLIGRIASSVMANKAAAGLLAGARTEVSMLWDDGVTGVRCKGRIDGVSKHGALFDLKTSSDASADGFGKSIANFGYHIQAAHYIDGFETEHGERPSAYVWIVVEKEPPHAVALYAADSEMIAIGSQLRTKALDLIAECRATGVWPGFDTHIKQISLPAWAV